MSTFPGSRPSWDDYFLDMLDAIASRATCDRGRSACVVVSSDNQILATGYVGAPSGMPHCDDVDHLLSGTHCVRTVHAEQNALAAAARRGVALVGATWYTNLVPCRVCALLMVTVGATCVRARYSYHDPVGLSIFSIAGIECTVRDPQTRLYVP